MAQLMTPPPMLSQQDYPLLTDDFDQPWSHHGRFGRLSYMAWVLIMALAIVATVILLVIVAAITGVTFDNGSGIGFMLMGALGLIPFLYFLIVFQIRRLHDLNLSGWWIALPLMSTFIAQVLIAISHSVNLALVLTVASFTTNILFIMYLMIAEGSEGLNDYGTRRITLDWEKMTGWVYVVLMVIGLMGLTWTAIPAYQSYQKQAAMMHVSIQLSYSLPASSTIQ